MLVLSEQLKIYQGAHGIYVRKAQPKRSNRWYVTIGISGKLLHMAGLHEVTRMEAGLEEGKIVLFEAEFPNRGWALVKPRRNKRGYLKMPYREGLPFVLNDNERHQLKEVIVDAEKQTITMATAIEES